MRYPDQEILIYAISNDMIDIDNIQEQIAMKERKRYLEIHESKIWQSTDDYWYTYLPDMEKGRRLVKRKTKEALCDMIISYYKEMENEPTLENVFYEWVEQKLRYKEIQKQTYDRYMTDFARCYKDTSFSKRKVKYLDENGLEDFIKELILNKGMTSKAYANLRTITRGMLRFAKKRGYTNFNVNTFFMDLDLSKKMFCKKHKSDTDIVFTKEEIRKIMKFLLSEKDKVTNLAVLMAMYTGMRVGEIVALKWEDIQEDFIHVNRRQVYYKDVQTGKRIYEIKDFTKTDAGIRDVVIIPELKEIIKKIRAINPFSEYLFEKKGTPISIHAVAMVLYRACDKLGLKRRGMHSLRKTYATILINAGVDESIVINQMGHTDFSTTKDYYYYNNKTNGRMKNILSEAIDY